MATLAAKFAHAIKNSLNHKLQRSFSERCCAKNTQSAVTNDSRVDSQVLLNFAKTIINTITYESQTAALADFDGKIAFQAGKQVR